MCWSSGCCVAGAGCDMSSGGLACTGLGSGDGLGVADVACLFAGTDSVVSPYPPRFAILTLLQTTPEQTISTVILEQIWITVMRMRMVIMTLVMV